MKPEEQAFLEKLKEEPDDLNTRGQYADWLTDEARYVEAEVQQFKVEEYKLFLIPLANAFHTDELHIAYADWLDQHGRPEEADRHREYPKAEQWLQSIIAECNPDEGDDYECSWSYEEILEQAKESLQRGERSVSTGNNETLCDVLRAHGETFWQYVSIVTGIPLPADDDDEWFGCAC